MKEKINSVMRMIARISPFVFMGMGILLLVVAAAFGYGLEVTQFVIAGAATAVVAAVMFISYVWCFVLELIEEAHQAKRFNPWKMISEWAILCAGFLLLSTVVDMGKYPTAACVALGTIVVVGGKAGRYVWRKQLEGV